MLNFTKKKKKKQEINFIPKKLPDCKSSETLGIHEFQGL